MPIYLYCVVGADAPPPHATVRGIDHAAVRAIDAGPISAWVSDMNRTRIDPTLDRVRAHDAVNDAAVAGGTTPLPARFGQLFANERACRDALAPKAESLAERLRSIAGQVEMRVI